MIQTIHRTTITSRCPVNSSTDLYDAEFHVDLSVGDSVLEVEAIQKAIDDIEAEKSPIYQEELTRRLADNLRCKVVLNGRHTTASGRTFFSTTMEDGSKCGDANTGESWEDDFDKAFCVAKTIYSEEHLNRVVSRTHRRTATADDVKEFIRLVLARRGR